ncbi:MAG: GcrA cell cycle regulator [Candidatus Paceibacteria bacterium]|jgi:GcrA cell cycle regulator
MSWTDERVELLKTMWTEGKSASQIAKELGGVTRNAVIGKVHRLGLSNRATSTKPARDKAAPREASKPKSIPQPVKDPVPEVKIETRPAIIPMRKPILIPGQPLPPQPSANEISPEALASVKEVEKKAKKLNLLQLTERTCKWPIGDPATDEFWFCGLTTQTGKPYCDAHVSVAFQPMSNRRDRRASR